MSVIGDAGAIGENETLVDAYLVAIADGFNKSAYTSRAVVDVVVEPYEIDVSRSGSALELTYRGASVLVHDPEAFGNDLARAAESLITVLDQSSDRLAQPRPQMPELRRLAKLGPAGL